MQTSSNQQSCTIATDLIPSVSTLSVEAAARSELSWVPMMVNQKQALGALTSSNLFVAFNDGQQINLQLSSSLKLTKLWSEIQPNSLSGFSIQMGSEQSTLTLSWTNSSEVAEWVNKLFLVVNLRNFKSQFKAIQKLGNGSFARVYLAKRLCDQKLFAVKVFSKQEQAKSPTGFAAFNNEVAIMRGLNHPNLLKIECVYQSENSLYIVLEYLQGKSLWDLVSRKTSRSEALIKNCMIDLLSGLNELSRRGIIHRDIKPHNLVFRNKDLTELVICDFGLSTPANVDQYLFDRCGTSGFIAPEIINKTPNAKSNPISDVFSAGVIFHILLFGNGVFTGSCHQELTNMNRKCELDFSADQYYELEEESLDLLFSMLERDPTKRISAQAALNYSFFNTMTSQTSIISTCSLSHKMSFSKDQYDQSTAKNLSRSSSVIKGAIQMPSKTKHIQKVVRH